MAVLNRCYVPLYHLSRQIIVKKIRDHLNLNGLYLHDWLIAMNDKIIPRLKSKLKGPEEIRVIFRANQQNQNG